MNYRDLEIWQLARKVVIEIHRMSLTALPKFEMYEVGTQIRRSVKSIKSNIVEGFGRRRYKQEFIRFLIFAQALCDETVDHLETLFDTESLRDEGLYVGLQQQLDLLGKKINAFTQSVELGHRSTR